MERDDKNERIIKTGAFANVNKQIGNMKTDHIREKIFKRHGHGKNRYFIFVSKKMFF